MRITPQSVEQVKDTADILSVASEFTTLKRVGQEYVGLCPYPDHDEKTPSFGVSSEKGLYHCFACSRGGDAIKLVMDLLNLEFVEAIEHLAERHGVELEHEGATSDGARERTGLRKEVLRALDAAASDYHEYLMRSPDDAPKRAREYLAGRGITIETLKTFRVGYSPSGDSGKGFSTTAKNRHDLEDYALEAAGLVSKSRRDRFSGRIVFPIKNTQGRIVGFGGRVLPGEEIWKDRDGVEKSRPKYLNSSGSTVFEKSRLLYGLDQALPMIRNTRRAVVVEGYTDVLMLHQTGVLNAVATCGTAVTTDHLRMLAPQSDRIVLVMDPDDAGEKAVARARDASEMFLDLRVAVLDADPADWMREHEAGEFNAMLDTSLGIVEHEIARRAKASSNANIMTRSREFEEIKKLLSEISDPVQLSEYQRICAAAFSVPLEDVRSGVSGHTAKGWNNSRQTPARPVDDPATRAERYLLSAAISYPLDAAPVIAEGVTVEGIEYPVVLIRDDFVSWDLASVYEELGERAANGRSFGTTDLVADESLREHYGLLADLSAQTEDAAQDVRYAIIREAYLRVAMLSRRRLRAATDDEDPAWDRLYKEDRAIERSIVQGAPV